MRGEMFVVVVIAWAALFAPGCVERQASAGTQQCNTECQSKMTDCILACDGIRSCEEACKKKGESCVAACSSDASPAAPTPPSTVEDASVDVAASDDSAVTPKDAGRRRSRDR
ncbi:MAG: hypothetical protein ABW133_10135 [Polyangiaceae bacterium]